MPQYDRLPSHNTISWVASHALLNLTPKHILTLSNIYLFIVRGRFGEDLATLRLIHKQASVFGADLIRFPRCLCDNAQPNPYFEVCVSVNTGIVIFTDYGTDVCTVPVD